MQEKYQTPLKKAFGAALDKYQQMASENPEVKLTADMLPISGAVTSVADALADAKKEKYAKAAIDLLGVVPGAKLIKGSGLVKDAMKYAGKNANIARLIDKANDSGDYVSNFKKGGGVSAPKASRGDGCAQRGKTKGRIV
jgi:hypothetical protein